MSTRSTAPVSAGRPGLMTLLDHGQLIWRLLQDDRVPTLLKVSIPLGVAVYAVTPLDLIPDFIPVLGQLDDLGVLWLGMLLFINLAPRDVVNEHRATLGMPLLPTRTPRGADGKTTIIDSTNQAPDRP
ncbi:MAG TPA: DUF1232 domain-containing protein [Chloroflexia bacterium]|nr:DUF1232 domain-containing protein [Chloroflexia bacterium]